MLLSELRGFSRTFDDDGRFPTQTHRENPGKSMRLRPAGGPGSSKVRENPNSGELNRYSGRWAGSARRQRSCHRVPSVRNSRTPRGLGLAYRRRQGLRTFPTSSIFGKVAGVMLRKTLGFTSSADRPRASFSGKSPVGTWWQLRYPWAVSHSVLAHPLSGAAATRSHRSRRGRDSAHRRSHRRARSPRRHRARGVAWGGRRAVASDAWRR